MAAMDRNSAICFRNATIFDGTGRDICQTGGMLDWNPSFLKLGMEGLGIFVDGPWEVRKAVRQIVKEGADMVKMYITGEGLLMECQQTEVTCTQEELDAMVDEAH